MKRHERSHLCPGDHPKIYNQSNSKMYLLFTLLFFSHQDNNYLECFNGENMPKQSFSFSSPREIKGSSSPKVLEEELATDVSDLVARSCCITLKYSSSVLALAKRDWALECLMVGSGNPLAESQFRIKVLVNLDCSSNFDHNFTLKVLCRISWASWV